MRSIHVTNGTLISTCEIPDDMIYKNGIIPLLIGTKAVTKNAPDLSYEQLKNAPDLSYEQLKNELYRRILPIPVILPMTYSYDDISPEEIINQSGF